MLLGFDCDAVLIDTLLILCAVLTKQLGRPVDPDEINYYCIESNFPGMTSEEAWTAITDSLTLDNTLATPPVDGALDFLRWYAKTHPIYIITNRVHIEPVEIYFQHHMDYNTYRKTKVMHAKKKGPLCRKLGITHFVEDNMKNIVSLANNGVVPVLFRRQWNKDMVPSRSNLSELMIYVSNWEDVYSLVTCEQMNLI